MGKEKEAHHNTKIKNQGQLYYLNSKITITIIPLMEIKMNSISILMTGRINLSTCHNINTDGRKFEIASVHINYYCELLHINTQ
jgi:hypothetical protein